MPAITASHASAGGGVTNPRVTTKTRDAADAGSPQKYAMDEGDIRTYRQAMVQGPYRAFLGSRTPVQTAQ